MIYTPRERVAADQGDRRGLGATLEILKPAVNSLFLPAFTSGRFEIQDCCVWWGAFPNYLFLLGRGDGWHGALLQMGGGINNNVIFLHIMCMYSEV